MDEVYFTQSVAQAVDAAHSIAEERYGHRGLIRKVIPEEIKDDQREVEVRLELEGKVYRFHVQLQKEKDQWLVKEIKEEGMGDKVNTFPAESVVEQDGYKVRVSCSGVFQEFIPETAQPGDPKGRIILEGPGAMWGISRLHVNYCLRNLPVNLSRFNEILTFFYVCTKKDINGERINPYKIVPLLAEALAPYSSLAKISFEEYVKSANEMAKETFINYKKSGTRV